MPWWVWVAAGLGGVALLGRPRSQVVLADLSWLPSSQGDTPAGAWVYETRTHYANDPWSCGRGESLPLPNVSSLLPAGVGGPIVLAADAMIGVVKQVFDQIGWRRACTVRGGRLLPLAVIPAERVQLAVRVVVGWRDRSSVAAITFRADDVSSTGWVPPVDATGEWVDGIVQWLYPPGHTPEGYYATDPHYLAEGGAPSVVWPHHPGVQRWAPSVSQELDQPTVQVERTGAQLRLSIWLPPRSGRWRETAAGLRRYDRDVQWTIDWAWRRL